MVREKWLTRKKWVYTINPPFFRLEKSRSTNSDFFSGSRKVVDQKKRVCRSTFLEPLFYTFLEKWLQIKWSTVMYIVPKLKRRFNPQITKGFKKCFITFPSQSCQLTNTQIFQQWAI